MSLSLTNEQNVLAVLEQEAHQHAHKRHPAAAMSRVHPEATSLEDQHSKPDKAGLKGT